VKNQKKRDFELFAQPGFLVALALLLANDFYLKSHYANWLTGKLSDFAGLYVFTQFVATCLGGRIVSTAVTSAVLFTVWKSPMATPLIEIVNRYSVLPIHRTIDYTDLMALAVLPVAVRFFAARNTFPWSFIKYPVAALTMLGIMATSTIPRYYNVRMDLREIPTREGNMDSTYAEIDKLLATRGMRCVACAEESPYREYLDSKENISAQLNYDNVDRTLFVSLRTNSPDTAKSKTDELQAVLMELLRPRFENITVLRTASAYETTAPSISTWELEIEAPSVGNPLSCSRNGVNHPEIAKALAIFDESVRMPSVIDLWPQHCSRMDDRCSLDMCRKVAFGQVTGSDRFAKSILVSTWGHVGWGGTSVHVELTEYGDAKGEGAAFMDGLEKRLRTSLSGQIQINVVKSTTQPRALGK
jgi:hypothetical protein